MTDRQADHPRGVSKRERLAVLGIAGLALAVRSWGIGYGLPETYFGDEPSVVRWALAFGTGDLNPHAFHWPAFHLYVLFGLYGVLYVAGLWAGRFESREEFAVLFFQDPSIFFLSARALSALFGTATVLLTWRIGRTLFGPRAGILAALCLALTHYHVRDSHVAILDVPMTFWATAAIWAAVSLRDGSGTLRRYVGAGALAGLATATKYNGGIAFLAVIAAHVVSPARRRGSLLVAAAFAAAVAFSLATPYNWLDWPAFAEDLAFQREHLADGQERIGTVAPWLAYLGSMTLVRLKETGIDVFDPMVFLFAAGVAHVLRRSRPREWLPLLATPIGYVCVIFTWGMVATRYLNPLFPPLSVAAGAWIATRHRGWAPLWVACLLLSVRSVVLGDLVLSRTDTRTEAKVWIERHVPHGSRIALESRTPPLAPSAQTLERRMAGLESGRLEHPIRDLSQLRLYYDLRRRAAAATTYDLVFLRDTLLDAAAQSENRAPQASYDLSRLEDLDVCLVVLSSFIYDRYRSEPGRTIYPKIASFYDEVDRRLPLVREFRPDWLQPGPTIRVFSLGSPDPLGAPCAPESGAR